MTNDPHVLIAGGGPVGLFAALILGLNGLTVRLFDANSEVQRDPRAATTHPGTLEVIDVDGLVEDMKAEGLVAPTFQFWDRPNNRLVAEFDHAVLASETKFPLVIQCEQYKTSNLILKRLKRLPNVEVLFDHEVIGVEQNEAEALLKVRGPRGIEVHRGQYVIGADGGRSVVRKGCGIPFEGFTWDERFVVLTTPFDFEAQRGYAYRSYFADPLEWCNCFKVSGDGPPGLWRTVFPAISQETNDTLLSDEAVHTRIQRFFPSSTPYDIVHRNIYTTHQRVAASFVKGRVVLAGDSAHINNPIGGMGLNGGLQDAENLARKLTEIILNDGDVRLLDLYNLQRRAVATEFVQEQSIANKRRLEAKDEQSRQKSFAQLAEAAQNPELAKDFLLRSSMITAQRRAAALTFADLP